MKKKRKKERHGTARHQTNRFDAARQRFLSFFFAPASPRPLAVLRVTLAIGLILQALALYNTFFLRVYGGPLNFISEYWGKVPGTPGPHTFLGLAQMLGGPPLLAFHLMFWPYLICLLGMAIGFLARPATIGVWLFHMGLFTQGAAGIYGVDEITHFTLFYLAISPAGAMLSLDAWRVRRHDPRSWMARFSLRLLQITITIFYFNAGAQKTVVPGWWNGDFIWKFLNSCLAGHDFTWLARFPWLLVFMGWGVLLLEIAYPLLVWIPRTRLWGVAIISLMHVGAAVSIGIYSLSALMIILNICLFGISAKPSAPGVGEAPSQT